MGNYVCIVKHYRPAARGVRIMTMPACIARHPVLELAGRRYTWWPRESGPGFRTSPVVVGGVMTPWASGDAAPVGDLVEMLAARP